jgi:hypothetical protein
MSNVVHIALDRKNRVYRTGEIISGTVEVAGRVGHRAKRIVLRTWWETEGKGARARGGKAAAILHEGAPPEGTVHRHPFHFVAPDAPFTYVGRHLAIEHHLQAVIELPMAPDLKVEETFVLTPGDDVAPAPEELLVGGARAPGEQPRRPLSVFGAVLLGLGIFTMPFPGILLVILGLVIVGRGLRTDIATSRIGKVSVEVEPRVVAPGDDVQVRVTIFPPKPVQILGATASLRAREICESGGGNNRKKHRHLAHAEKKALLGSTVLPGELMREATVSFTVPALGMWSFKAPRNEIRWDVDVAIQIPSWPDWKQTIPIVVWPAKVALPAPDRTVLPAPEPPARPASAPPNGPGRDRVARPVADRTPTVDPGPAPDPPKVGVTAQPPSPPTRVPPEPAPAARAAPAAPVEDRADAPFDLATAVGEILETRRYSPERDDRVASLVGQPVEAAVIIERIDRPFGRTRKPGFEDGRIVRGRLRDSQLEVEVHIPTTRAHLVEGLGRTDPVTVAGSVTSWERLPERPVIRMSPDETRE